jgi:hypothetical protein
MVSNSWRLEENRARWRLALTIYYLHRRRRNVTDWNLHAKWKSQDECAANILPDENSHRARGGSRKRPN